MTWVEIVSAVLGLSCVFLAGRNSKYNFYVGYVYNVFLFVLFMHQHLYSAMILQPISLMINAYGHWRWTHPREEERSAADSSRLKVGNIPPRHLALYVLAVLGASVAWAFVLKFVFDDPANPYLDSLMLMLTLCAQYLSARKYWECWIVWLLVNIGTRFISPTASGRWCRGEKCTRTMSKILLEIKNLHAGVAGKEILKGIDLTIREGEVHAVMGPNGAGKSTLGGVLTGRPGYEVTEGSIVFDGKDLLSMSPEERSWAGIFLSFQYPVEIPGVSITNFMKAAINAKRKALGQPEIKPGEFLKLLKEKMALVGMKGEFARRDVNVGFSGGEKKRDEIFQMAMLEPRFSILDETDSGLDVDALKIVADGVRALRTPETSTIVITHYRKLLDYIVPDVVHVLKDGRIVETAGRELADRIENEGYESLNG